MTLASNQPKLGHGETVLSKRKLARVETDLIELRHAEAVMVFMCICSRGLQAIGNIPILKGCS